MNLILIATLVAKADKIDEVKRELLNLVEETHNEDACLIYDLLQHQSNPAYFTMYEVWESEAGLQLHNQQPYIRAFSARKDELLERAELNKFDKVS